LKDILNKIATDEVEKRFLIDFFTEEQLIDYMKSQEITEEVSLRDLLI